MSEPQNPQENVIGELTQEELTTVSNYQRRANQLMFELGELEVRKHRCVKEIDKIEEEAATYLREIGARLGLEENQLFRIVDGKVILVGPQKPQQLQIIKG